MSECTREPFSRQSAFTKKDSVFGRKASPFSRGAAVISRMVNPFQKIWICPFLLMEDSWPLLLENGEKIRL